MLQERIARKIDTEILENELIKRRLRNMSASPFRWHKEIEEYIDSKAYHEHQKRCFENAIFAMEKKDRTNNIYP